MSFDMMTNDKPEPLSRAPTRSPAAWALEVLQHIPDNVFAQDIDGRIPMANQTLTSTYSYAAKYQAETIVLFAHLREEMR